MKKSVIIFIMILSSHNSFHGNLLSSRKNKEKNKKKDGEKERLKYHTHFFSAIKHKA